MILCNINEHTRESVFSITGKSIPVELPFSEAKSFDCGRKYRLAYSFNYKKNASTYFPLWNRKFLEITKLRGVSSKLAAKWKGSGFYAHMIEIFRFDSDFSS